MKQLFFGLLLLPFLTVQAAFDLGEVQIQVLGSGSHIETGQFAEVAKFRVSNRTGRNLVFENLRLRNYGSADLDESFSNPVITTTTNERLGQLTRASRKYWDFAFSEAVELGRGDSVILSIKAQLTYAQRGETVELGFRRLEDLGIIDKSSGFGVRCNNCEGTRFKTYTLDPGGISINRRSSYGVYRGTRYESSFSRPVVMRTNYYRPTTSRYIASPRTSQQYSPGSRDVVFFSSRVSARQPVAVDGIFLQVASGSQAGAGFNNAFGDWQLLVNGVREDSTSQIESYRGQQGLLFDSSIDLPANAQISVVGRVKNGASTGDRIRFRLDGSGLIDPEYLGIRSSVQSINGARTSNFSSSR